MQATSSPRLVVYLTNFDIATPESYSKHAQIVKSETFLKINFELMPL